MKIKYIIFSLATAAMTGACSDDAAPFGEKLVSEASLTTDIRAVDLDINDSKTIRINASDNMRWETLTGDYWYSLSRTSGTGPGTITISVTGENPSTTERTGTVRVYTKRYVLQTAIGVSQKGAYIDLSSTALSFEAISETKTFNIESNVSWTLSTPSWISTSVSSGRPGITSVSLTSENSTLSTSSNEIVYVNANNNSVNKSIHVTREGIQLDYQSFNGEFEKEGGTHQLTITSNTNWTISNKPNWISLSKTSGTKTMTIDVTASSNTGSTRDGYISIISGNVKKSVYVRQKGKGKPEEGDNTTPKTSRIME